METPSIPTDSKGLFASCGECLKLKLPWKKRRSQLAKRRSTGSICDVTTTFYPPSKKHQHRPVRVGGFKYDPLSYAQNFDDTAFDYVDDEEYYSRGFSSRFAAPAPKTFPTVE